MKKESLSSILQKLIAIALPLSASRLINIMASFISMMMVASLGKDQLAAGALGLASTLTIITLTLTMFYAVGIKIRYEQGPDTSPAAIGILVKNGFLLAMLVAVPATVIIVFMPAILLFFGQEPQLVALTVDYFLYSGLTMFPLLAMLVLGQFYIGINKPSFVLLIELISLPLTVLTSYGFVLGHFGLPQMGLGGIGLANLLTQSLILAVVLTGIYFSRHTQVYQLFKNPLSFDWPICRSLFKLGFPIGIQFGGELAAVAGANYLMGFFGVNALAALQTVNQYTIIVIMLSVGLSQALSLMVSEQYGKSETNDTIIKQYIHASMLLQTLYMLPVTLVFLVLPAMLAQFYMGTTHLQPDFQHLITAFFLLNILFLWLDGTRNLLSGALRGLHDTKISSHLNLAAMWLISLPVSWFVAFVCKGGPIALRFGFLSGFLVAVILLLYFLHKKLKEIYPLANLTPFR